MLLKTKVATYTLIGMAKKFQDFFHSEPKDVTFEYMDMNENVTTETIPNIKKVYNDILSKVILSKQSKIDDDILETNTLNTLNSRNGTYSVSLPSNPDDGDIVFILDVGNYADANSIIIGRNNKLIADTEDDLIIDISSSFNILFYLEETGSWYISILGD